MRSSSHNRLVVLDVARAISAFIVVAGHLRAALLPDFQDLDSPGYLTKLFYLVSGMGHEAVMVFFVMSGYFVGGAVLKAGDRFDWHEYVIARLSRLWVVLLPALALTALCDSMLLRLNPGVLDAEHLRAWHSLPSGGHLDLSWSTALMNALFLQTVFAPPYGSNGALWSLANEAWYYLVFPLALCGSNLRFSLQTRISFLFLALLLFVCMPSMMRWLFLVWLMGASIHRLPRCRPGLSGAAAAMVTFLIVLVLARADRLPYIVPAFPDLLVGAAFAAFCFCAHNQPNSGRPGRVGSLFIQFSEMSFSLYVIHMPLMFLLMGVLLPNQKTAGDAVTGFVLYPAVLFFLIAAAAAWWWMFERHAMTLRRVLSGFVGQFSPSADK